MTEQLSDEVLELEISSAVEVVADGDVTRDLGDPRRLRARLPNTATIPTAVAGGCG